MKKTNLLKKSISRIFFNESFFKILIYFNFKNKKFQIYKELRGNGRMYYYADREFFNKYNRVFCSTAILSLLAWILEYRFLFEKIFNKKNNRVFYNLSSMICSDQEEINFHFHFLVFSLCEKIFCFFLDFLAQNLILMFCVDFKKHTKKKPNERLF